MIFLMENQIEVILRQLEKDGQEFGNPNFFTRLFWLSIFNNVIRLTLSNCKC